MTKIVGGILTSLALCGLCCGVYVRVRVEPGGPFGPVKPVEPVEPVRTRSLVM